MKLPKADNSKSNKQWKSVMTAATLRPAIMSSPPTYQANIYSYYCTGHYSVSSRIHGSKGVCKGFKSKLEKLADMKPNTRAAALKEFTYVTDFEPDEEDLGLSGGVGENSDHAAAATSVLVSPALIHKELLPPGAPSSKLPEEEIIQQQSWDCYGRTDVQYLVLKDTKTGDEHVAAVAPQNNTLSWRKIHAEDFVTHDVVLFGHLNFRHENHSISSFEQPENDKSNSRDESGTKKFDPKRELQQIEKDLRAKLKNSQPTTKVDNDTQEIKNRRERESSSMTPSSLLSPDNLEKYQNQASHASDKAISASKYFYNFTLKVGEHVKQNAEIVYNITTNGKAYDMGKRIVHNIPVTAGKFADFASRKYDEIVKSWNEDHDDSPINRRKK